METAPAARFSKEASGGDVQASRGRQMDRLGGCARLGHISQKMATGSMNGPAGVTMRLQQWPTTYLGGATRELIEKAKQRQR